MRFGNDCETPCYTNMFGGPREGSPSTPYQPIPSFLDPLLREVSHISGCQFNCVLARLYLTGEDNIAWHTDGRTFLEKDPVIASMSLGDTAKFRMRKMMNVWPCARTPDGGVDNLVEQRVFECKHGTMLVMEGDTQR